MHVPQQVLLYVVLDSGCGSLQIRVIFQTWQNPHRPLRFCLCLPIQLGGCLRKVMPKNPDLPIRSRWGRVYSALEVPMVNAGEIRTHLRSLQRIAHTAISPRYTKIECRSPVNGVFGSCCVGKALRVLLFSLHCIACRPFSIL